MANGTFEYVKKAVGLHDKKHGLLSDRELRLQLDFASMYRTDWMHNMLQNGMFAKECSLFAGVANSEGLTFQNWLQLMAADRRLPRARAVKRSQLFQIFNEHNEDKK